MACRTQQIQTIYLFQPSVSLIKVFCLIAEFSVNKSGRLWASTSEANTNVIGKFQLNKYIPWLSILLALFYRPIGLS